MSTILSAAASDDELYGPAMEIGDPDVASAYIVSLVQRLIAMGIAWNEAEEIELNHLAFYAGSFSDSTRLRVETLFGCVHPFFGSIADRGPVSSMEAWTMGYGQGWDNALGQNENGVPIGIGAPALPIGSWYSSHEVAPPSNRLMLIDAYDYRTGIRFFRQTTVRLSPRLVGWPLYQEEDGPDIKITRWNPLEVIDDNSAEG